MEYSTLVALAFCTGLIIGKFYERRRWNRNFTFRRGAVCVAFMVGFETDWIEHRKLTYQDSFYTTESSGYSGIDIQRIERKSPFSDVPG